MLIAIPVYFSVGIRQWYQKYGDPMEEGIAMVKLRGESAGAEEETQPCHTSCV